MILMSCCKRHSRSIASAFPRIAVTHPSLADNGWLICLISIGYAGVWVREAAAPQYPLTTVPSHGATGVPMRPGRYAIELSSNRAQPQNCAHSATSGLPGNPLQLSADAGDGPLREVVTGARAKLQEREVEHASQLLDRASCPGGAQMVLGPGRYAHLFSAGTWLSQRTGLLR